MNAPMPAPEVGRAGLDDPGLDAEFERLYRDNHAFVWRCARRMCVAEDELDDVIQDVFVVAYRRRDRLEPGVAPSTWLFGILRNVVRNRDRGLARHRRRVSALAEHVEILEQQRRRLDSERLLGSELLGEFLGELDEGQRAVFVLAELEGYTGKEIAAALGINPNTAHSRLRLARRAFCAHFELEPRRAVIAATTRELRDRPEQPSAEARAHSWGLLVAALARPGAVASAGAGGVFAALASKLGLALAGLVVLGAAGLGLAALTGGTHEVDRRAPIIAAAPTIEESSADEVVVADAPAEPVEFAEPVEPLIVQAPRRPTPASPSETELEDPAEQLRAARAALIDGRPDRALALLDAIPESDPRHLSQRAATRVAALCKLGEIEEARAVVARLRERDGDSSMLARIDGACW